MVISNFISSLSAGAYPVGSLFIAFSDFGKKMWYMTKSNPAKIIYLAPSTKWAQPINSLAASKGLKHFTYLSKYLSYIASFHLNMKLAPSCINHLLLKASSNYIFSSRSQLMILGFFYVRPKDLNCLKIIDSKCIICQYMIWAHQKDTMISQITLVLLAYTALLRTNLLKIQVWPLYLHKTTWTANRFNSRWMPQI